MAKSGMVCDQRGELNLAMGIKQHINALAKVVLTFLVMMLGVVPYADAAEPISIDNLQAAMQTLNFLDSLPKEGPVNVGVIYASEISNSQLLATETAKAIGAMRGPNKRDVHAVAVSIDDLSHYAGHLDVLFLIFGASNHSSEIVTAIRRLRAVSISDDPACMPAKCCVLLVRSAQRVEITLNSALADVAGARFSPVFIMVVKRT
jgi:YfiR/HmsC-like